MAGFGTGARVAVFTAVAARALPFCTAAAGDMEDFTVRVVVLAPAFGE
jgi:hypothetical protein